jgi:hypothetical protein
MKEKLRNLFDEMKVRSRYKSMNAIINMIEPLINQEVEKRIAEVLPTKNEIGNACQLFDKQKRPLWKEAIWRAGANWAVDIIRSRLTCSKKPNNSQKTEGGEE